MQNREGRFTKIYHVEGVFRKRIKKIGEVIELIAENRIGKS